MNNANKINHMFACCYSLKELKFSNFSNNIVDMFGMFSNCTSLKK